MVAGNRYSFSQLASVIGGDVIGHPDDEGVVRFLLTDSRQLTAPGTTLFFAIRTEKSDGHKYIDELLVKGVRFFVVESLEARWQERFPEAAFINVNFMGGTIAALHRLAAFHRAHFNIPVVGITGSNGKTIVKEWLFQLLSAKFRIVRNPKSYNSQIGVPLSVWQMGPEHELGIFEAGISQPGEMEKLQKIINPDIGIFTNIGPAHDSGFGSVTEKIREKLRLFKNAGTLIYCKDHRLIDLEVLKMREGTDARSGAKLFCWGEAPEANLRIVSVVRHHKGTDIKVNYQTLDIDFTIPFNDSASLENAMHCVALMLLMGLPAPAMADAMSLLQPVAMRLEMKEGINHCSIINDSYNSDLGSLAVALDFLSGQKGQGRTTLIISDILQTGMHPHVLYTEVSAMIAAKGIDRVIGIGGDISAQHRLFPDNALFFTDTEAFIRTFDFSLFRQEVILLKGARVFGFERLGALLQQKDHQTVLEVDLDALVHNLNVFRSRLPVGIRTMGMVKAFSYGSGSIEIANMLQYHHIDYLAVAYADEGKILRQGGIKLPIMVMNPEVQRFETLFAYELEPEIYSQEMLERFVTEVRSRAVRIHVKIDTGMRRLGFLPSQVGELAGMLKGREHIRVASVFSHFAASEDPAHDEFSRRQLREFRECCALLREELGYSFLRHISNSAAVVRFPDARFDMVRLGIGLYGICGDAATQGLLQHVSTFKSVVSQLKQVQKGETVGYSRAGLAGHDMEIAIVPVGYADGLRRILGNGRGTLYIGGRPCRLVGNISMDMCAVDVTGMHVKAGDEVIIFGKERTVSELARDMDTIPYEVLTSVSQRVKRVYYQG